MEFTNVSAINKGYVSINALDESKKASNFEKEFNDVMEELNSNEEVKKINKPLEQYLSEIKTMIRHLVLIRDQSEFYEYSKQLSKLIQSLLEQLKKSKCSETKTSLIDLFNKVDTQLFKPQINLIQSHLKNI